MDNKVSFEQIIELILNDETWELSPEEKEMYLEGVEFTLLGY